MAPRIFSSRFLSVWFTTRGIVFSSRRSGLKTHIQYLVCHIGVPALTKRLIVHVNVGAKRNILKQA